MWDMLYAFGIGIAFSIGVATGALLCRLASKEGRSEFTDELKAHQKRVEDRLSDYVTHTAVIAQHLEKIANR